MAEQLTAEAMADAEHGANEMAPEDRRKAIVGLHNAMIPIEQQIENLRLKLRSLRSDFKEATGIALGDFDAVRRVTNLDDDDIVREKIAARMACYRALAPGHQLQLLTDDLH